MFSSTAPILRWSSPEGRDQRRMGRRLNDAFTSACLDENLKCSVNCCIVRLSTTNSTTMTEQDKITIFDALIKPFLRDDSQTSEHQEDNLFALAIRQLLNSSLLAQRDKHLECERYERIPTRNGQRNGFKPRTIRTSTGQITLDVPQVRNSQTPFIPIIPGFERGSRIDRALNLAIAEMYLQGVSTRKVAKVMNEICGGNGVSATYVSQCCAQLDTLFEKWRNRPIPPIAHLFLDATDTKVRRNKIVSDGAVFVAVGIEAETGRRMVLGISVGLSEAAEHWTAFIQSLMIRGMNRPNCITSDDHKGIRKALAETLTGVPWQRCQFHFQQNAQAHVTSVRYRSIAAAHIRNVFNAGNRASAKLMIQNALSIFRADKQYKLADWVEENIEECLTVIDCPPEVQRRLRTSNIMECINRQLKRRTNVISIFPSEASLLRIVTAKAMDLSDEWEGISGKSYISPEKLQLTAEALQAASSQPQHPAA